MKNKKWRSVSLVMATMLLLGTVTMAAEMESGSQYCFSSQEFEVVASKEVELTGVMITEVPDSAKGTVKLGDRIIRSGDFLTAQQVSNMIFYANSETNQDVQICYLPIYGNHVEQEAVVTVSIMKRENQAPVVADSTFETYKNLENKGTLNAKDPEGESMTFKLVSEPRRGNVVLHEDGTFTYTPKKNKVGKDSFTFTATDVHGAVSQEHTVKIEILKPLQANLYRDVQTGQFEAMWMANTGLYTGSQVAGENCFGPEDQVSRGDFLAMTMKLLEVPVDEVVTTSGFSDEADAAVWIRPYLATAMRIGIVQGSEEDGRTVFRPNDAITGAEAAMILDQLLDLPTVDSAGTDAPVWAEQAVMAMSGVGITMDEPSAPLTRLDTAKLLYAASKLKEQSAGLEVLQNSY